jgi:hypothetical protein
MSGERPFDRAGAEAMNLVTREELHEVKTKQALLEQAITQIADSTKQIADSMVKFAGIADRFESFVEQAEADRRVVAAHETELAVMRSHDLLIKVQELDKALPGLKEVRTWVVNGVLAIVASVVLAVLAVILH